MIGASDSTPAGGVARAKFDVELAYDQRADAAAAQVLRRLLTVILDNREGALDGRDPEYLHQLRIAVRRSRTVQRQLRRVFPAVELPGFRSEFRWLQRATGPARDYDVHVEDFDALAAMLPEEIRPDLRPLRPVLAHGRLAAHAQMARALTSRRASELVGDWERLLESLVEHPVEERPDAGRPIGEVVAGRIHRVYLRIVQRGGAIDDSSSAEEYHELRKMGKELRYLLELFALSVFGAEAVRPLIASLKGVQDTLGRHQDREVQIALLRAVADEVATLRRGPAACLAMGVLIDRLRADELVARHAFAERLVELAGPQRRASVEATFA
ncbi:MAG: CHAD domain-containing protein [Solirubrobacterales bacterium]|nr:CHAD domain-containing protein [Solirubrobacterales bacterium]